MPESTTTEPTTTDDEVVVVVPEIEPDTDAHPSMTDPDGVMHPAPDLAAAGTGPADTAVPGATAEQSSTDALAGEVRATFRRVQEEVARRVREYRRARARKRGGASNRSTWALLTGLLVLFAVTGLSLAYLQPTEQGEALSLSQFQERVGAGEVQVVTFLDEDARIVGEYVELPAWAETRPEADADDPDAPTPIFRSAAEVYGFDASALPRIGFWTDYPASDAATGSLLADLRDAGVAAGIDHQATKGTVRLVSTVLLPLMILANLFALLFVGSRDKGGAIGELTNFASVGDKRGQRKAGPAAVTFDNVAGAQEAVVELAEVVDYLVNPDKYASLGAAPPKGVLLFGPPGCGKTLLAKAVAGEAGVPFFNVAGAEFVEQLVGVGAARVRDLFARVRAAAPAIVFIDEIDAAGRKRGSGDAGGGTDEREQTLNQLLVEMDGFGVSEGIVVIGATNRPDILDPALLRPGRFDRHVTVEKPDPAGREEILRLHARKKPVDADVDWADVARRTPGYTGADLANVVNEAALLTIRQGRTHIGREEVVEAVARARGGTSGKRLLTVREKQRVAIHEAAHAVVVAATGGVEHLDRVTILSRGGALGGTRLVAGEETAIDTESELLDQLTRAMAGSAGELLVLDEASSAGEADLESATGIALDLVARYGMTEELGPIRLLAADADGFLGGTQRIGDISPETHRELDLAVRDLVAWGRDRAWELLEANRAVLDQLTEQLLEREHVEGALLASLVARVVDEHGNPAAPAEADDLAEAVGRR